MAHPKVVEVLASFEAAQNAKTPTAAYGHTSQAIDAALEILVDNELKDVHNAVLSVVALYFDRLNKEFSELISARKDTYNSLLPMLRTISLFNEPEFKFGEEYFSHEVMTEIYLQLRKEDPDKEPYKVASLAKALASMRKPQ